MRGKPCAGIGWSGQKKDLQAARVDHESGLFKAVINRSYYAIFHSIRAVNILDGFGCL